MTDTKQVPIFYINLQSRPDRRERMERRFTELGLHAERIDACTPESLPADCLAAFEAADEIRRLAREEMACLASHRAALRAVIDSGAPAGVVLEDDVRIARAFGTQVANLAAWADFDIVRLETFQEQIRVSKPARPLTDGFVTYGMTEYDACAAGYVVTREGAERYLAMAIDPTCPADDWLFNMQCAKPRRLRAFQLVPAVVIQYWHRSPDDSASMDTDLQAARERRYKRQDVTFVEKQYSRLVREVRRPVIRLGKAIERFRHGNRVFYRRAKPFIAFADDLEDNPAVYASGGAAGIRSARQGRHEATGPSAQASRPD